MVEYIGIEGPVLHYPLKEKINSSPSKYGRQNDKLRVYSLDYHF